MESVRNTLHRRAVYSELHGHSVVFPSAPCSVSVPDSLVEFGENFVAIPSGCPLDLPARITLRLAPGIRDEDARIWCQRRSTRFVEFISDSRPILVFDVDGFSNYKFGDYAAEQNTDGERQENEQHNNDRASFPSAGELSRGNGVAVKRSANRITTEDMHARSGDGISAHKRIIVPLSDDEDDMLSDSRESTDDFDVEGLQENKSVDDDETSSAIESEQNRSRWNNRKLVGVRSGHSFHRASRLEPSHVRNVAHALFHEDDMEQDLDDISPQDRALDRAVDRNVECHTMFPWRLMRPGMAVSARLPKTKLVIRDSDEGSLFIDTYDDVHGDSDSDWELPSKVMRFPRTSIPHPPFERSLFAGRDHIFGDPCLSLGRSFRICLDGNGRVHVPSWRNRQARFCVHESGLMEANLSDQAFDHVAISSTVLDDSYVCLLRMHIVAWVVARSTSSSDNKNIDRQQVPNLSEAFSTGSDVVNSVLDNILTTLRYSEEAGNDPNARHARIVFGLVAALYRTPQDDQENLLNRVVKWVSGPASLTFDEPIPTQAGLERALALLTACDIDNAVHAAFEAGYYRIALMIARSAESDKETLREDAIAQLECYGITNLDEIPNAAHDTDTMSDTHSLSDGGSAAVTTEELMILFVLAGAIAPVARRMGLSWYRVFGMELVYGAGSIAQTYADRVSAAVGALSEIADIVTLPPHRSASHQDAALHLLRLYADPTSSYLLAAELFSPGSFGHVQNPMDFRFPWLLHQILSAILPQTLLLNAAQLSDSFAYQLSGAGSVLWSFYVICSGLPPASVVKKYLIDHWPSLRKDRINLTWDIFPQLPVFDSANGNYELLQDLDTDDDDCKTMGPLSFLAGVVGVPLAWIYEAEAIYNRMEGKYERECECWLHTGTREGMRYFQQLIVDELFPKAISLHDDDGLDRIRYLLLSIDDSIHPPNWSVQGGLILDFLNHVPHKSLTIGEHEPVGDWVGHAADVMGLFRSMSERVVAYATNCRSHLQHNAVAVIADGIANAERLLVLLEPTFMEAGADDLERMPVSPQCLKRICAEYKEQSLENGVNKAAMGILALPAYVGFIKHIMVKSTV